MGFFIEILLESGLRGWDIGYWFGFNSLDNLNIEIQN
jgi:hypothetical protein